MAGLLGQEGIVFQISAEISRFTRGVDQVKAKLDEVADHARGIQAGLASVANPLMTGLGRAMAAVTASLSAASGLALHIGGAFESSMTRVAAISGATAQELDGLTAKARQLGRDLPISASDAADALTVMAQRGWDVKEMLGAVGDVVNLSISQQFGLAESADVLGATLTNFGLGVGQASRVVDVFNNASNQSAMSMSKFSFAMKYVAPNAAALNMTVEQTVALMEALSDAGLQGEQIGTGLRMVLGKLAEHAGSGGEAFRKLGVSILDASGKLRPAAEIFRDLGKANMDLATAQRLFGVEAGTSGLILAKSANKLQEYEKGLRETGTTQEMVDRQTKTWRVSLDNLKSSLEDLGIEAFEQIRDGAVILAGSLTDLTNTLTGWVDESDVVRRSIVAFATGLGLAVASGEDLKAALSGFDVGELEAQLRGAGEAIRAVFDLAMQLAHVVPWEWLSKNLRDVAIAIATLLAGVKIAGIVAGITQFCGSLALIVSAAGSATAALALLKGALVSILAFSAWGIVIAGAGYALVKLCEQFMRAADAVKSFNQGMRWSQNLIESLGSEEITRRIQTLRENLESLKRTLGGASSPWSPGTNQDALNEEIKKREAVIQKYEDALDKVRAKEIEDISDPETLSVGAEVLEKEVRLLKEKNTLSAQEIRQIKEKDEARAKSWREEGVGKPLTSAMDEAWTDVQGKLDSLNAKARNAMQKFGLSADEAGRILGESLGKHINEVSEKLAKGKDNPFAERVVRDDMIRRLSETGDRKSVV